MVSRPGRATTKTKRTPRRHGDAEAQGEKQDQFQKTQHNDHGGEQRTRRKLNREEKAMERFCPIIRSPIDIPQVFCHTPVFNPQEHYLANTKSEILQGTLDLMVLKTLEAMGPQHGYGIARRIEQISEDMLQV